MRKIVCAALRITTNDGLELILPGVRHYDLIMNKLFEYMDIYLPDMDKIEQGFLDNRGEFVARGRACEIAMAANQIVEKTHPRNLLFSEDLY